MSFFQVWESILVFAGVPIFIDIDNIGSVICLNRLRILLITLEPCMYEIVYLFHSSVPICFSSHWCPILFFLFCPCSPEIQHDSQVDRQRLEAELINRFSINMVLSQKEKQWEREGVYRVESVSFWSPAHAHTVRWAGRGGVAQVYWLRHRQYGVAYVRVMKKGFFYLSQFPSLCFFFVILWKKILILFSRVFAFITEDHAHIVGKVAPEVIGISFFQKSSISRVPFLY